MSETRVVNRRAGQPFDVYIGRPSKWGNPFKIGPDGTREQVVAKYEEWLMDQPELILELPSLRGLRLGCYCAPLPCHGDVLARFADVRGITAILDPHEPRSAPLLPLFTTVVDLPDGRTALRNDLPRSDGTPDLDLYDVRPRGPSDTT